MTPVLAEEKLKDIRLLLAEAKVCAEVKSGVSLKSTMIRINRKCLEAMAEGIQLPDGIIKEGLDYICCRAAKNLGFALAYVEAAKDSRYEVIRDYSSRLETAIPVLARKKLRKTKAASHSFRAPAAKILEDFEQLDEATKWGFKLSEDDKQAILTRAYEKGVVLVIDVLIPQAKKGSNNYNNLYKIAQANSMALQKPMPTKGLF